MIAAAIALLALGSVPMPKFAADGSFSVRQGYDCYIAAPLTRPSVRPANLHLSLKRFETFRRTRRTSSTWTVRGGPAAWGANFRRSSIRAGDASGNAELYAIEWHDRNNQHYRLLMQMGESGPLEDNEQSGLVSVRDHRGTLYSGTCHSQYGDVHYYREPS